MAPSSAQTSAIAVIEDEQRLRTDLVEFMQLRGFVARGFESAEAFFEAWPAARFDLLLLDVTLPGASGLEVARVVREHGTTGIVMLTALGTDDDQVAGLSSGADAYLSKRSSLDVIEATCHSVLRRLGMTVAVQMPTATMGVWRLRPRQWKLELPNGAVIDLTHTEQVFLSALFEHPGVPVERERLLSILNKPATLSGLRNLDSCASRLKRKVQQAGAELPLRPSYTKGYTFTGECEVVV